MKHKIIAAVLLTALVICMMPVGHAASLRPSTAKLSTASSGIVHFRVYLWDETKTASNRQTTIPAAGVNFNITTYYEEDHNPATIVSSGITDSNGCMDVIMDASTIHQLYIGDVLDADVNMNTVGSYDTDTVNHLPSKFRWGAYNASASNDKTKVRILRIGQTEEVPTASQKGTNDNDVFVIPSGDFEITFICYIQPVSVNYFTVKAEHATKAEAFVPSTIDATALVSDGYLYGGIASDATYTLPKTGVNGKALTGQAGVTYYVREVPDTYLRPASMAVQRKEDSMVEQYMITAVDTAGVDNGFYQSYGFMDADQGRVIGDMLEDDGEIETSMSSKLYDKLQKIRKGRAEGSAFTASSVFGLPDGYLGCIPLTSPVADEFHSLSFDASFTPFYVTADGVLVTGIMKRYMNKLDKLDTTVADVSVESLTVNAGSTSQKAMAVKSTYRASDSDPNENLSAFDVPTIKESYVRALLDEDCRYVADISAVGADVTFEDGYVCVNDVVILDDTAIRQGRVYSGDIEAPSIPEGTTVKVSMYYIAENGPIIWCTTVTYVCRTGQLCLEAFA